MRRFIIHILVVLYTCISCVPDFDELNDTSQRHIIFTFDVDSLCVDVVDSNGVRFNDMIPEVSSNHLLRITAYCYDMKDSLLCTDMFVARQFELDKIKIRHLYKDETYRFVFLADVVRYDPYVSYYETWYHLGTKSWADFYIYADARDDNAVYNVLGLSTFVEKPDNQTVNVKFRPISYNGYYIFDDVYKVDRLDGYIIYCVSFNLKSLSWNRTASLVYEFDYFNEQKERIVKPVSLCAADSLISAQIRKTSLQSNDTLDIKIHNKDRRPFIITVNCDRLEVTDCKFY